MCSKTTTTQENAWSAKKAGCRRSRRPAKEAPRPPQVDSHRTAYQERTAARSEQHLEMIKYIIKCFKGDQGALQNEREECNSIE